MNDSWAGLIILGMASIIITYPVSLLLCKLGYVVPYKKDEGYSIFKMANLILRKQLLWMFLFFIISMVIIGFLLIAWILIGGLLDKYEIIQVVDNVLGWPFVFTAFTIHILAQGYAYRQAVYQAIEDY